MVRNRPHIRSQITFLYYPDLEPLSRFYGQVLGLALVEDQEWAKIYAVGANAFLDIVAGEKGFHQPRDENAVLVTLVVDEVVEWYEYLSDQGVTLLTEVRGFFL